MLHNGEKDMKEKWQVLATHDFPQAGIDFLRENRCEVEVSAKGEPLDKREIMEKLPGKQALCCDDAIDAEIMDAAPDLIILATYGVGYDHIDVDAATRRGILVTNTPGVLTASVADLAWGLLLCIARRVMEADAFVRSGKFRFSGPKFFLGQEIEGKSLGIIGAGRIGTAVARRAQGFEMKIIYYDLVRNKELEKLEGKRVELNRLLKNSHFISIHVPLRKETKHLIGAKELKLMKKSAYLINTSRGAIIDESALMEALMEQRIAGAALDVYENEPELTPGLADMKNVVLTPHIGSATSETREKMAVIMARNCMAGLKGERPPNLVNPEALRLSRIQKRNT